VASRPRDPSGAVRPMTESDTELRQIAQDSDEYRCAVDLRYRVFFEPTGASIDHVFDAVENDSLHLVALRGGGEVVGYSRLTMVEGNAQISQMVVEPRLQGEGIGAQMMTDLVRRAFDGGARCIHLNARTHATPFYARFGFTQVGDEFFSTKTGLPHVRMERRLPTTEGNQS